MRGRNFSKAKGVASAALLSMQVLGCKPVITNQTKPPKSVVKPVQGWVARSYAKVMEREDALKRAEVSFYKDPEMACVEGDRGVPWIRKLYRRLIMSWAEKFCPHKRHIVFDKTISKQELRRGKNPAQCVACEDHPVSEK